MMVPALGVMVLVFALIAGVCLGFFPGVLACYTVGVLCRKTHTAVRRLSMYGTGLVVWGIATAVAGVGSAYFIADAYSDGGMSGRDQSLLTMYGGTDGEIFFLLLFYGYAPLSFISPFIGELVVFYAAKTAKQTASS